MTDYDYTPFEARVTALSPLHIGTGRELMQDYDYAVRHGQTWRLNETALLDAQDADDPALVERLARTPPAQLLKPDDFKPDSPFFRYFIKGQPRSQRPGSILREQIKTVDDRPYLPASSLKGALRTALGWHGWQALGLRPDRRLIDERRPRFAAHHYEQKIFGPEPNYDLLRALQIGDSEPLAPDCLMLANVKVLMARGEGSPIEVEAIRPETRFRLPLKVDTRLFSDWARARKDFRLGGAREWLESLAAIAHAHAQERVKTQRAWYEQRPDATLPAGFYRDLDKLALKDYQFVIQLGWGGGWDSKTFGTRLGADGKFMDWLISTFRMARGQRQPGDPFPKSRRAVMRRQSGNGDQTIETPAAPLGWVLVELKSA